MPRKKESKPPWACKEGCDLSKQACPHLEKLLPKPQYQNFPIDRRVSPDSIRAPDYDAERHLVDPLVAFLASLNGYGLAEEEIEVLVARFYYEMSLKDIVRNYNFTGKHVLEDFLKRVLGKLKDRKFRGFKHAY